MQSLPLRERGLKSGNLTDTRKESVVAPLAGAWIEMYALGVSERKRVVAPLAGAWIEMETVAWNAGKTTVAPLAGAWIEIA